MWRIKKNVKVIEPNKFKELLIYDSLNGVLLWKTRSIDNFKSSGTCKYWNKRYAGNIAGRVTTSGYLQVSIFDEFFYAHRIAYSIFNNIIVGTDDYIDHIDGNRLNNSIDNLRMVSIKENSKNQKRPERNSSGCIGVRWHKRSEKWIANITFEGKLYHLGYFDNIEDAILKRKEAENNFSFHKNHGRN